MSIGVIAGPSTGVRARVGACGRRATALRPEAIRMSAAVGGERGGEGSGVASQRMISRHGVAWQCGGSGHIVGKRTGTATCWCPIPSMSLCKTNLVTASRCPGVLVREKTVAVPAPSSCVGAVGIGLLWGLLNLSESARTQRFRLSQSLMAGQLSHRMVVRQVAACSTAGSRSFRPASRTWPPSSTTALATAHPRAPACGLATTPFRARLCLAPL